MSQESKFLFGPFEFQPAASTLIKHGHRIKLQPKAASVLAVLLEQPGVVASRAQLQKRLWSDGTHVDFESGIKVAVKKLRDALADRSDEPVYIQTVPGEGYRFIAPVTSVPDSQAVPGEMPVQQEPAVALSGGGGHLLSLLRARRTVICAVGITSAIALVLLFRISRPGGGALHFRNRDWVVIAAFENHTGERLLDGAMEFALERELSESRYVNVAQRDRINDALRLMRRSPSDLLDADLARQVAIRDGGIKAVLAGRIEKFGSKYVLTVRLVDPATGDTAAVFSGEGTLDQFPRLARAISDQVRHSLGETRSGSTVPKLERATTPSMAALNAFSAGMRYASERNWRPAAALFEEAVRKDAQFALAHIYAAHCYSNVGDEVRAAPHYEAAFRLSSGVSDRERLFILGSYYSRFLHDDRKAMSQYEALVTLYPDDYWGQNNLQLLYEKIDFNLGHIGGPDAAYVPNITGPYVREAAKAAEHALALRPNANPNPDRLFDLWLYFRNSDPAKAQRYAAMLRQMSPTNQHALEVSIMPDTERATKLFRRGDVKAAVNELAALAPYALRKGNSFYIESVASMNLTFGRLSAADDLCHHIEDARSLECQLLVASARRAPNRIKELLPAMSPPESALKGIPVAVQFHQIPEAEAIFKTFKQKSPTITGFMFLGRGRLPEAIHAFESEAPNRAYSFFLLNRLGLALALERSGKVNDAISALESVTRPEAMELTSWWPDCRMKLAKLYRAAGRTQEAAAVEDDLRSRLSEADRDDPLLAELGSTRR